MLRAITFLNEAGDTTITWTSDRDDEMEKIIQKKMDAGVVFFVIERRFNGEPDGHIKLTEKNMELARKYRALSIPNDEDLAKFVESGSGRAVKTPKAPVRGARKSKSAREVASSESVGVRQMRGG